MLSNPGIKQQLHSLQLSNKGTDGQIEAFLSFFSLDKFSHLRSLTLIDVKRNNVEKLKSMLPLVPKLSYFRLIDHEIEVEDLVSALPLSKLRTLSMPKRSSNLAFIHEASSIINLTFCYCSLDNLCQLLRYVPMLQYLNAQYSYDYGWTNNGIWFNDYYFVHLKCLIMVDFPGEFNDVELLLKQIPNLKSLTISSYMDLEMINASRWQHLITSSLLHLNIFKFKFGFYGINEDDDILGKFEQFQSDFWHKEHQWYTEHVLNPCSVCIYTIPYRFDSSILSLNSIYYNNLVNNSVTFDNVMDITLDNPKALEECQYYFSNVTSLTLEAIPIHSEKFEEQQFVQSIKRIIDLSHLKHLRISMDCSLETSLILLQILKEAPHLSSMAIGQDKLTSFFIDKELCKYLNKMIKKLNICVNHYDFF